MPSERFYRLPDEKKQLIRRAAIREFARVPIDKVSINKIIKDADISRGSFYTYFADKWDVLSYIFEDWQAGMRRFCRESLEKNNGNVWVMMEDFLDVALSFCSKDEVTAFVENVLLHSSSEEMLNGFSDHINNLEEQDEIEKWLYETADIRNFQYQSFEDFHRFINMAMSALSYGIKEFYQGISKDRIKEDFIKKLELLRFGVCRHEL